jgi:hypothetical protein
MDDSTRPGKTPTGAEADPRAAELRFVTHGITDEEAAAVTAVLLAALDDDAEAASAPEPARNPWVRSARALRAPLQVGPGNWSRSTW